MTDPAEVANAVLETFGIREPVIARRATEPGTGPLDRLVAALADRDEPVAVASYGSVRLLRDRAGQVQPAPHAA